MSDLKMREPDLACRLTENPALGLLFQAESLPEDAQVLGVGDLRGPQAGRIHARPNAALRAVGLNDFERGFMQVGTRVGQVTSGADEIDLGVEVLEAGET